MDKPFSLIPYYTKEYLTERFALYEIHERVATRAKLETKKTTVGTPIKNSHDDIIPENIVNANQNVADVEEPRDCGICLKSFSKVKYNRYKSHKKYNQDINRCCICHQTFASQEVLLTHALNYAHEGQCCSCANHGVKNLVQRNLEDFKSHTFNCDSQRKHKKRKQEQKQKSNANSSDSDSDSIHEPAAKKARLSD